MPLRLGGLILWLYLPAYVLLPGQMAWSTVDLAPWVRWGGLAAAALLVPPFVWWAQHSLGTNVTPTVITKNDHQLVTHGPYCHIRHPLYTAGAIFFLAMSLAAESWFLPLAMLILFPVVMARIPKEEAVLEIRFGDDYLRYKRTTGRFLPRTGRHASQSSTDA